MRRSRASPASPLVSMPEIAELAGVRRPVVTTWRRRHAGFPAPAGTGRTAPLFDARQVVDWLVETGRAERARIEPDLRLHLLAGLAVDDPGGSPRELVTALTALVCLRHLDDQPLSADREPAWRAAADLRERAATVDPDDLLLRSEIGAIRAGGLAAAADELVEAAWGCRRAYERVLAASGRLGATGLSVDAVTGAAAGLVAGLSGAREHADSHGTVRLGALAAGTGDLLFATLDQLGEGVAATIAAAEPDPVAARMLRRRLVVRELPLHDWSVHIGDQLPAGSGRPDVFLVRLRYQPWEERSGVDPLACVRELTGGLRPGQTAVVLGPADLLVGGLPPYRPAARTRNALLASGRVEAVIHLPGGLVPYRPGYQTAVWVLRREDPSPWRGRVLLADVSDRELTPQLAEELVGDVVTWRREGYRPDQHLRAHAAQVAVEDLLGPGVPLTTRRPRRPAELVSPAPDVARILEIEATLDRPLAAYGGVAARPEPVRVPRRPIGALARDGWLVVRSGHRLVTGDVVGAGLGHHRVLGAPELTGTRPPGERTFDRGVLAARYPRVRLSEPGDVVVTLTPRLGVHLDREGFSVVEFPARVLRIPPEARHRLTPRVLVALLSALPEEQATGRAAGAVRAPVRLAQLQLPLLSPDDVARLDELLTVADERRRELDLLDELCRITTSGLSRGTLTMAGAPGARPDR